MQDENELRQEIDRLERENPHRHGVKPPESLEWTETKALNRLKERFPHDDVGLLERVARAVIRGLETAQFYERTLRRFDAAESALATLEDHRMSDVDLLRAYDALADFRKKERHTFKLLQDDLAEMNCQKDLAEKMIIAEVDDLLQNLRTSLEYANIEEKLAVRRFKKTGPGGYSRVDADIKDEIVCRYCEAFLDKGLSPDAVKQTNKRSGHKRFIQIRSEAIRPQNP